MFYGDLELKDNDNGTFTLMSELRYDSSDYRLVVIPVGFVTDLASVPWFGRIFIPVSGNYNKATVLHDYCIQHISWKAANRFLCESMGTLDVKLWRRITICAAVNLYKYFWSKH